MKEDLTFAMSHAHEAVHYLLSAQKYLPMISDELMRLISSLNEVIDKIDELNEKYKGADLK